MRTHEQFTLAVPSNGTFLVLPVTDEEQRSMTSIEAAKKVAAKYKADHPGIRVQRLRIEMMEVA